MSFQLFQRSFFVVWYRMGSSSDDAPPDRAAVWPPPEPEEVKEQRDGVPLTEDLIRRKAEHNEGMVRRPAARTLPPRGVDLIPQKQTMQYKYWNATRQTRGTRGTRSGGPEQRAATSKLGSNQRIEWYALS